MAITYFIFAIYIILIFIEIFIISMKVTGLPRDKARFQVISLLTSTGFTTRESELITQHPTRRKIAERIMIFKYFAGIIGTATLFNAFINSVAKKTEIFDVVIWIALLSVIFIIMGNRWIINKIDSFVEYQLMKQSEAYKKRFKSKNLWTTEEFGIVDIVLSEASYLIGIKLKDSGLKSNFIQVLQVDKGDMHYPFPKADYVFEVGDRLTIYGNLSNIKMLIMDDYANDSNRKVYSI